MADQEKLEEEVLSPGQTTLDLERLVGQPAWKEALLDLVVREQLDPWNIDVGVIAEKFLESIKGMQKLDLHLPANMILAASILLRFKSDTVHLEEEVQVVEEQTFLDVDSGPVDIPLLTLRTRIPPKRKVTLEELVGALEEVFEDQKKHEERMKPVEREVVVMKLPEFNIETQMAEVHKKILASVDSEGLTTFSQLLSEDSREQKVYTLLPLLFLTQSGKISMFQEKFFGEIFVQVAGKETSSKAEMKVKAKRAK